MSALVDPVLLTLIALLVGFYISTKSKRYGLSILSIGILSLYLSAIPIVSQYLLSSVDFNRQKFALLATAEAEAIVILGGDIRRRTPEFDGDTVGRLSLERVRYGARIYRQTGLPILTTGGRVGNSETSVATAMAVALREDYQVPVKWIERSSRNTYENAKLSSEILNAEGIKSVYLVTHSWHMPRALEAFQQVGVKAIPRPTGGVGSSKQVGPSDFIPNSGALTNSAFALHEWIGRYWYRVRYY